MLSITVLALFVVYISIVMGGGSAIIKGVGEARGWSAYLQLSLYGAWIFATIFLTFWLLRVTGLGAFMNQAF